MASLVRSIGTGTATGQDPADAKRSRRWAAVIGLVAAVAIVAAGGNWWYSTRMTPAGDLPDSPGVEVTVDGLHVLDAYLVTDATRGSFAVVCALVTSSGGPDRLTGVTVGDGAAARPLASAPGDAAGLPVGSERLLLIGPEAGAVHITVTGVTHPAASGSLTTAMLSFAHRGPVSIQLPVWTSVSGPAGPD